MARIYAGCLLKVIMESSGLVERSFKTQEVNFIHLILWVFNNTQVHPVG